MKCWKKQKVEPNRILWTKGKFKPGKGYKDSIHLDKIENEYEVGANKKINPETINGHFKFFKTRPKAVSFVNKYLKENSC